MSSIEELERSIAEFQRNITRSNELLNNLAQLMNETDNQNKKLETIIVEYPQNIAEAASEKYVGEINRLLDKHAVQLKLMASATAQEQKRREQLSSELSNIQKSIADDYTDLSIQIRGDISREIKEYPYQNMALIEEFTNSIERLIKSNANANEEARKMLYGIKECSSQMVDVNGKLTKLKESITSKLIPLYVVSGITLIISVLSLMF